MPNIDKNKEEDAKYLFESFFPDYNSRKAILSFIADSIVYANKINKSNWNVNLNSAGQYLQFNVGVDFCVKIKKGFIEVLSLRESLNQIENIDDLNIHYRGRKKSISKNIEDVKDILHGVSGSVACRIQYKDAEKYLSRFRIPNNIFIDAVSNTTLRKSSMTAHSTGVIKYLSSFLNRMIPNPQYRSSPAMEAIHNITGDNPLLVNIIEDEIEIVNSIASDRWAIAITKQGIERIRVHFAGLIIFTVSKEKIWMSVNPNYFPYVSSTVWQWEERYYKEYVKYKPIKIRNGNLISFELKNWDIVKQSHFDIIKSIAKHNYVIKETTKQSHNNDFLIYFNRRYDKKLPFPEYVLDNELRKTFKNQPEYEPLLKKLGITEKQTMINQRIGQNYFREQLLKKWGNCQICGIENNALLRASHIKPWSESDNKERLDSENGLLLCANHDALFDKGLIFFDDDGSLKISDNLTEEDSQIVGNLHNFKLPDLSGKTKKYIRWHRERHNGE